MTYQHFEISPLSYREPNGKLALCNYRDLRKFKRHHGNTRTAVRNAIRNVNRETGTSGDILDALIRNRVIKKISINFDELLNMLNAPSSISSLDDFFAYYS